MGIKGTLPNAAQCAWCGQQIDKGAPVIYVGRRAYHPRCAGADNPDYSYPTETK